MKSFTCRAALLAAGLLFLGGPSHAQEQRAQVPFDGSQGFRHLLGIVGATPLNSVQELAATDPREAVLVVFGDTAMLFEVEFFIGRLKEFKKRGGAILIATDRPDQGRLQELGLQVTGRDIPIRGYHGLSECPMLTDCLGSRHPLFAGLSEGIATNRPSELRLQNSDLQLLAGIHGVHIYSGRELDVDYIAGSAGGRGQTERVLIIAGHGVFLNGMIAQHDNDNFKFSCNCVGWLIDKGKRSRVLFIEEGKIQTDFHPALSEMPPLPLPSNEVLNRLLRGLEEENRFNQLLLDFVPKSFLVQVLLAIGTFVLAVAGLRLLFLGRYRLEPGLPLVSRSLETTAYRLPLPAQRQADQVRAGNLFETARTLARACFEEWGAASGGPPVVVATGWWRRWRRQRQVHRLWELAYGERAGPVSLRKLSRLRAELEELKAAVAAGDIEFRNGGA
jgi:hypothetical protein